MRNRGKHIDSVGADTTDISVREIIRTARGMLKLNQTAFAEKMQTSQSLISKYESGKTNPPADIIDKCMLIIHRENIGGDVSITALEARMRRVLSGPAQAGARKAFAVILDSLLASA